MQNTRNMMLTLILSIYVRSYGGTLYCLHEKEKQSKTKHNKIGNIEN